MKRAIIKQNTEALMKASGIYNMSAKSYTPYGISTPEASTYQNSSPGTAGFSTS